jgi:hypothetical protein
MFFEAIPAHIPLLAKDAPFLVEIFRDFWSFVADEIPHRHTDEIIAFLSEPKNLIRLKVELDNPRKWDVSKTLIMTANSMGVDLESKEGLEAFAEALTERFSRPLVRTGISRENITIIPPSDDPIPSIVEARPTYSKEERQKILNQKLGKNKKRR